MVLPTVCPFPYLFYAYSIVMMKSHTQLNGTMIEHF